jgi:hypothetical protein
MCEIGAGSTLGRLGPGMGNWNVVDGTPCEVEVWEGVRSRLRLPPWSALVPIHMHLPGFP